METPKDNKEGEGTGLVQQAVTDVTPLSIIRTEATLSRFPIHTLEKRGNVNIRIVKKTTKGEVDVKWIVSHNSQAGRPGQLAYKLDTIIINRRIDEAREEQKLLPEIIRLGSLYEIAQELGLGRDTNSVRKALLQNSGANIDAKIRYTTTEGVEREVTFNDTRYGVFFTGEKFPDGRKADAVYLSLHSFYREVLNSSPVRPLNYDYLKELPPSAQRFYEIVSRKIFAALKHDHPRAKLLYSEFCTFSAQTRQVDYDHFKKQMYKVHRPHIKSGYISDVAYEQSIDEEGKLDWVMFYTPGPKAKVEFNTFNGAFRIPRSRHRTKSKNRLKDNPENEDRNSSKPSPPIAILLPPAVQGREIVVQKILTALTERGLFASVAEKLLSGLPADRTGVIEDYIDYFDSIPADKKTPGLLHNLILNNDPLPASFETRRKRSERLDAENRRRKIQAAGDALRSGYEEHCRSAVDRFITEELTVEEFERRVETHKKAEAQQTDLFWKMRSPTLTDSLARSAVRAKIGKELNVITYEDFCKRELPRILADLQLDPAELGIAAARDSASTESEPEHPTE